jgi:hypothetical protein
MSVYYNREGQPMDHAAYLAKLGDKAYRRVAKDTIGDSDVSTVWLGLDHGWGYAGAPVIFESMVFRGGNEEDCVRYSTEADALAGHAELVAGERRKREP